jgi:hypothetical protein
MGWDGIILEILGTPGDRFNYIFVRVGQPKLNPDQTKTILDPDRFLLQHEADRQDL